MKLKHCQIHHHHNHQSHHYHQHHHSYLHLFYRLLTTVTLLQSILLVVNEQQFPSATGTAIQLDNVDIVESVEAANKARIEAELQHEEDAKKHAQNVVRLAATDQLNSEIITNRTRAYLSCESGEMIVKINFSEPFRGLGYSDYDRSSPCKFYGDGSRYYEMRLPLKGCGTKQEAPRIFINNIILRFHRSLELEEDEIKTIICRYPPPLAPPPPIIAAPILEQPPQSAPILPAHLSEVELILIVSALLFLTLLLLGIGMGYYCLKRRNIKVIRKIPPPLPIPRASLSSSETYYEESDYDDYYRTDHHSIDEDYDITQQNVFVPPLPVIDTRMVDDRYVQNMVNTDIEDDVEIGRWIAPKKPVYTTIITDQYFISPTHTTEVIDEITTQRYFVPPEKPYTTKRIEDRFVTPQETIEIEEDTTQQRSYGPPIITSKLTDEYYLHPEEDTELTEEQITHRLYRPKQPTIETVDDLYRHPTVETEVVEETVQQRTVGPQPLKPITTEREDDYFHDVYEIDEMIDDTIIDKQYRGPEPLTTRVVQTSDDEYVNTQREIEEFIDDSNQRLFQLPPPPAPKPKIMVKNIDDFYVTNITETETDEKIIKTGQSMPNLLLMVDEEIEEVEEEEERHRMLTSGFDITMRSLPPPSKPMPPTTTTTTTTTSELTKETIKYEKVLNIIDNPPIRKIPEIDDLFPPPKRNKLRTVIQTDETFRTIIIESTTIEEYSERILHHTTYGPMFEPPTWEVIFRLLSLPEVNDPKPLPRMMMKPPLGSLRSHFSGFSAHEVRSVTEEDVNFTRRRQLTASHFVPPPDYDSDDSEIRPHWSSNLADPSRYQTSEEPPITHAFVNGRRRARQHRPRTINRDNDFPSSSVFGPRRLASPYNPYTAASPSMRRRLMEYGVRPYSPDIDALSLEPSSGFRNFSTQSYTQSEQQQEQVHQTRLHSYLNEKEEIKSTTETDVYDWKR